MLNCEHCDNLLLDFVYGLLEESDLQKLREHLSTCSNCQAALEATQNQQKLMARAALAIGVVPELTLPSDKPAAPVQAPATLPMTAAPASKGSVWRRPLVAWSAAAAILLAIGASISVYRHELHTRQDSLLTAREDQKAIERQIAGLPAKYEDLHKSALQNLRVKTPPYLHVVGPTSLQPNAKAPVHVTTRSVEGDLAASNIRIKLVDAQTGNVVHLTRLVSEGQARADIDASDAKPNSNLHLIVEADTALGLARLQETVRVHAPEYVACINTNKNTYQLKDVLFFRVLVLDRYNLMPPSEPIKMRAELRNPLGAPAAYIDLQTAAGGVLAGELPIVEDFLAGTYTLHVAASETTKRNVQPASQSIEVVRELPGLRLDANRYLPGGTLTGNFTVPAGQPMPARASGTIGNMPVDVTLQPEAANALPQNAGRGALTKKADKDGANKSANDAMVYRFSAAIPPNLPPGANRVPVTLQVPTGKKKMQEFRGFVAMEPTEFTIDFFPEGGDLIAGVKNRVFYRVRSKTGEPVTGEGRVILLTSKNDIVDTHYKLGLGYLDFTPDVKETYTVRITTPAKIAEIANPFTKPGIRRDGVVLHVTRAVGKEGDPIRVTLRQQGPARKLILLAHCRGQIVDERTIDVKAGSTDVTLQPTPDARGMIRVTAYEIVGAKLQPVAERLVYRAATQRLDLGFTVKSQQLESGQKLVGKINAQDAKGRPTAAWMLASVVDERFQPRPRSLSAHFLLLNEIRTGADLDNAQLVLNDTAESVQMLERFLGTHGWRRFVPATEPGMVVLAAAEKQPIEALIFSRENMPLELLQKRYETERSAVLLPLHKQAFIEEAELGNMSKSVTFAVFQAEHAVHEFQSQTQLWFRLSLGIALAILLGISVVMIGIGVYRVVRAHKIATPVFGGAFACLAVCLGIVMVGNALGRLDPNAPSVPALALARGPSIQQTLDGLVAQTPTLKRVDEKPLTGAYTLAAPDAQREQQKAAKAELKEDAASLRNDRVGAGLSEPAARALFARDRSEVVALAAQTNQALNNAVVSERYPKALEEAKVFPQPSFKEAEAGGAGGGIKPAMIANPPPAAPHFGAANEKKTNSLARRRDFAYDFVPNLQADTLLWHPTLWLPDGSAEVRFDIAAGQATYRVLLLGHSPTGRFGFYETRLDVPAVMGR